ncbi:MAG: carboxypeptidase-like regulatory domain-containing protein, partial [Fimbriimonadaceae bacterium]
MNRVSVSRFALFILVLTILACGGGGGGLIPPPAGTALLENSGSLLRMRGKLAFQDGAGNPIAAPAEGAVVFVGTSTTAGGAGPDGNFTIEGLPKASNLRVRCFARGFMPLDFNVPAGAAETNQLICRIDPNPGDNPQLNNREFAVANDGIMRFTGRSGLGNTLMMFSSPTVNAKSFTGGGGESLPVTSQIQGNEILFTGDIGDIVPTGSFHAFLSGATGVAVVGYGTCQLGLVDYRRAARQPSGTINGPNGLPVAGAEVLVFEQGNTSNRGEATTTADGRFG